MHESPFILPKAGFVKYSLQISSLICTNGMRIVKAMDIKQNLPNNGDNEKFLTKMKRKCIREGNW